MNNYLEEYQEYADMSFELGTTPMAYEDYVNYMMKKDEEGAEYAYTEGWDD